jgi:hypothetical protein
VWGSGSSGNAMRVGGSLAAVLAMLFAASMVAAGRWRMPLLQAALRPDAANAVLQIAKRLQVKMQHMTRVVAGMVRRGSNSSGSGAFLSGVSTLHSRMLTVELSVAALGSNQLLRDVLTVELSGIRKRMLDFERQGANFPAEKASSVVRQLARELDRISRIAQSAGQQHAASDAHTELEMPESISAAYRVLGMNADAAPAVAKKLVDALRMSWHPDHARDEDDRLLREARMKQINAAWDLIKDHRVAA